MHKEKFMYEVRENVYRIKIIRERPKIRIDEYIYGNIQNAIERRNEILTKYNIELYKEYSNIGFNNYILENKTKKKNKINNNSKVRYQLVDKYIYKLSDDKYRILIKIGKKYYFSKYCENLIEAKKIRNIKLAERLLNKNIPVKYNTKLYEFVKFWFNIYCIKELKPTTLSGIQFVLKKYILPELGNIKLKNINALLLQEFFSNLRTINKVNSNKKLSDITIHNVYKILRNLLNKAVAWEYIDSNPSLKIKVRVNNFDEKKIFDKQELNQILKLLNNESILIKTVFTIITTTGIRRSELLGLHIEDIELDNNVIKIRRNVTWDQFKKKNVELSLKTKSSNRDIPVPNICINSIKEYLEYRNIIIKKIRIKYGRKVIIPDNLFLNNNGDIISANTITHYWKEFRIKYKLKDVTVHGLRHSYCSVQVNENPNLSICDVSKIMGHSQISTTLKYSHVTKNKKEEVYSIFD